MKNYERPSSFNKDVLCFKVRRIKTKNIKKEETTNTLALIWNSCKSKKFLNMSTYKNATTADKMLEYSLRRTEITENFIDFFL